MLRLCLALPIFYPTFGGGSLRFMRYQPGLRKRGLESLVLAGTPRAKDASHTDEDLGWDAYPMGSMLPVDSVDGIPVHRVRLPSETGYARTSTYFRALMTLCRDPATRPDVIQLHSFERLDGLFWVRRLKRLGIPVVYAIQIARPARRKSAIAGWLKERMVRAFYDSFDGVITSSEQICEYLRELGVRVPIAVIPNGVDLVHYTPGDTDLREATRASLGIDGRGPVLLSVGAISPRKGSDLAIEAWSQLLASHPEAELVLVGPRHDRNSDRLDDFEMRLDALVSQSARPDRVHFAGVRDDLNAIYAAADLVLLPTQREGGTPNVVLEAMACERPVVLTAFEGQSSAIGRPGIEFEQSERNPTALAKAMANLLDDPPRMRALVERGREWVTKHLDIETSLDRFADFYERAAKGSLDKARIESENPVFPSDALDTSGASDSASL